MSIFRIFGGRTAADHEQAGDDQAARGDWGRAKIAYERAHGKLERSTPREADAIARVEQKIDRCREALAEQHLRDAEELVEGGAVEEARELVLLGLELSADPDRKSALGRLLEEIERRLDAESDLPLPALSYEEPDETREFETSDEEVFQALVAALPEEVQEAYLSYGDDFVTGYLALNEGDFETAADFLARALESTPSPDSYIPLELATAYLNLGRATEAGQLLEGVIERRPDTLPAYRMLCEIFWENGKFSRAHELLGSVPELLSESVALTLLKGETLSRAGDTDAAQALYREFIESYGWNDSVARALAAVHEASAEIGPARALYREMLQRCTGCGSRVDPLIRQKHADLGFAGGERSSGLIEAYLALAQEIPELGAENYDKVSRIYAAQGNTAEARRFRSLAAQAGQNRPGPLGP